MSTNTILTAADLKEAVGYFLDQDSFSYDVESTGEFRGEPTRNQLVWVSLATHGRAISIPFGHPNGDILISRATKRKNKLTGRFDSFPAVWSPPPVQLRPSQVFEALHPLLYSDRLKVAQNGQMDWVSTAKYNDGELPPPPFGDTIVEQWLLDENMRSKGLKDMVKHYYGVTYDTENVGRCIEAHSFSKVAHYAYMDSKYTWLLHQRFMPLIKAEGLESVWQMEMDLLEALCKMRATGAPIDTAELARLDRELVDMLVTAEARVYACAGRRFNINSNPQKTQVLYGAKSEGFLGLKPKVLTPGGKAKQTRGEVLLPTDYSTSEGALEHLANNPAVSALRHYQELTRLHTGYIRAYLGDADEGKPSIVYDGRLHCEHVQYGTVSGRFSCRSPNLQNVPAPGTELGRKVRGLFIAPPRHRLIVADYAQIELVVLAHYVGAGRLSDGFLNGVDAHTATAAAVFGCPPENVSKDQRSVAKSLNFAVVYGAGPTKVASMAKVSLAEAKEFMSTHQRQFPEIYAFKAEVLRACRSRRPPHLRTVLGRKRRLPTLNSRNDDLRAYAERQAVNSLIQGSAADLIKTAMVRLNASLLPGMHLILSVHDELVTIVPEALVDEGMTIVRQAMEGPGIAEMLTVPIRADVKAVTRWSEAK